MTVRDTQHTGANFDVAVALSGGVDSAMAAVLLKSAGRRVCGVHFMVSSAGPPREEEAREVADRLGIPLETIDLREEFEGCIVGPFCEAYLKGLTPNPCVCCNPEIKFKTLYDFCMERKIRGLATGHYVRVDYSGGSPGLLRGLDRGKDQSYFLQRLDRAFLSMAVFPLGEMTKAEIQARAREMDLPCHLRPESQEICFIPGMDYREFVENKLGPGIRRKGAIVTGEGKAVGEHEGCYRYTIGQRHGLGIASSSPYYVKEIRPETNEVVVARREELFTDRVHACRVHWLEDPPTEVGARMEAQVRYRHRAAPGRVTIVSLDEVQFQFDTSQWAVTPGQALALYQGDRLMAGGWIVGEAQGARFA